MATVIEARGLSKSYGRTRALDDVSFTVESGRITGLIGPNGAGKTTVLKAVLGLTPVAGALSVLGRNPRSERNQLMEQVCFIADVAVLPKWLRVHQALDYVAGVHPRFDRARAQDFLGRTAIGLDRRVRELSKGMVTQLHLALVLAIDARLLVLDEPTLGLDLLYRRRFYDTILGDYFDKDRTVLLATHQVEEAENLLTDVIFMNRGRVVLASSLEDIAARYVQLTVNPDVVARARAAGPFYEREVFGRYVLFFDGRPKEELAALGDMRTPTVADLFLATMSSNHADAGTAKSGRGEIDVAERAARGEV